MTTLSVILQISIALILIIFILLIALCILHRYTKRAQQRGEEVITLRNSFRCGEAFGERAFRPRRVHQL